MLVDLHAEHMGTVRMKALTRLHFWWPKLNDEIELLTKTSKSCQEHSPLPALPHKATQNWASGPWKRLYLDFAGPFKGRMFLIVVDSYSKCLEIFPMTHATSTSTMTSLRQIFATFGLPEHIVTDNGSQFTSYEFKGFLLKSNIKHTCTAPEHPATNGLAERYVGFFENHLMKMESYMIE